MFWFVGIDKFFWVDFIFEKISLKVLRENDEIE